MKYLALLALIISILFGIVLANYKQKNYRRVLNKSLASGRRYNDHSSVILKSKKVSKNVHHSPALRATRKNERKKESVYDGKELKACSTKDKKNLKPVNAFMCMAEKLGRFIGVFASFPWCSIINGMQGIINFFEDEGEKTCDDMCDLSEECQRKMAELTKKQIEKAKKEAQKNRPTDSSEEERKIEEAFKKYNQTDTVQLKPSY